MEDIILFERDDSYIMIRKGHLYIMDTKDKDISPRTVTIFPGFQVDMNRDIGELKQALSQTRLPIFFRKIRERNNVILYSIVRMATGAVDDVILAHAVCIDNQIKKLVFNRDLRENANFRKYHSLPIVYGICLPYDLSQTSYKDRRSQVTDAVKRLFEGRACKEMRIIEGEHMIYAMVTLDKEDMEERPDSFDIKVIFLLKEDGEYYELSSYEEGAYSKMVSEK